MLQSSSPSQHVVRCLPYGVLNSSKFDPFEDHDTRKKVLFEEKRRNFDGPSAQMLISVRNGYDSSNSSSLL